MLTHVWRVYKSNGSIIAAEFVQICKNGDIYLLFLYKRNFHKVADMGNDYSIDELNNLTCYGTPEIVDCTGLESLGDEYREKRESCYSLPALLKDLSERKALYIPEYNGGSVLQGYYPSFGNIRVSRTTMTISISCKKKTGEWYTKCIIDEDNLGNLQQNSFYFALRNKENLEGTRFKSKVVISTITNISFLLYYKYVKYPLGVYFS